MPVILQLFILKEILLPVVGKLMEVSEVFIETLIPCMLLVFEILVSPDISKAPVRSQLFSFSLIQGSLCAVKLIAVNNGLLFNSRSLNVLTLVKSKVPVKLQLSE